MKLKLSESSQQDLRHISQYTLRQWGKKQEHLYLNELYDRFEEILTDPTLGKQRNTLYPGAQSSNIGKHVIFYQLKEDTILVARILHQSMDFPRHLKSENFED